MRSKVFISYSHNDADSAAELLDHLRPLERKQLIDSWVDTKIPAGARWRDEIETALDDAAIAVLLASHHFLASDFIAREELPRLLSKQANEGLVVLPVVVSPCLYDVSPLGPFQSVNSPDRSLQEMDSAERNRAWVSVAETIYDQCAESAIGSVEDSALAISDARDRRSKNLDLTGGGLSSVPAPVCELADLTTLYLSRNNLSGLPPDISRLTRIKTLYISRNAFERFPVEAASLPNLAELYCSHNSIRHLPSEVRDLRSLRRLDLSHNRLEFVPSEIAQLAELQVLRLSENEIASLPSELGRLRNLVELDLRSNRLTSVPFGPDDLPNLQALDLTDNDLDVDPKILEETSNPELILRSVGRR